jgi:ribokinase
METHSHEPLDAMSVSDLCVDLMLRGNVRPLFGQVEQLIGEYSLELGGSANIFATQFARLGGRAGLLGRAGNDAFGDFALAGLADAGVDTQFMKFDAALKTGLGVALTEPHDRAILTYAGTIDAITPENLREIPPDGFRHWHIASYFLLTKLKTAWPEWCQRLRKHGVTISLDTNWDPENSWTRVRELLPLVDLFLPNDAEALAITGEKDIDRAGRALAEFGPIVVIKRGGDGASVYLNPIAMRATGSSSSVVHARPEIVLKESEIVDSVGAGDCFDAGFLRAWQLKLPLHACMQWGLRCGAANLRAAGGIVGQVREFLQCGK